MILLFTIHCGLQNKNSIPYNYDEVIKHKSYAWRFHDIRNDTDDNRIMHAIDNIRQNFLKVNIYLEDLVYTEYTDSPKVPFSVLLSQLGGALNLWAGITVVIVIEVIELFINLIIHTSKIASRESNPPPEIADV